MHRPRYNEWKLKTAIGHLAGPVTWQFPSTHIFYGFYESMNPFYPFYESIENTGEGGGHVTLRARWPIAVWMAIAKSHCTRGHSAACLAQGCTGLLFAALKALHVRHTEAQHLPVADCH